MNKDNERFIYGLISLVYDYTGRLGGAGHPGGPDLEILGSLINELLVLPESPVLTAMDQKTLYEVYSWDIERLGLLDFNRLFRQEFHQSLKKDVRELIRKGAEQGLDIPVQDLVSICEYYDDKHKEKQGSPAWDRFLQGLISLSEKQPVTV